MSKQDARPTPPEEQFTLATILAEFGSESSLETPLPDHPPEPGHREPEAETPAHEPAPEASPQDRPAPEPEIPEQEPQEEPEYVPEPVAEPEYRPDDDPQPQRDTPLDRLAEKWKTRRQLRQEPAAEPAEDDILERTPLKERVAAGLQWLRDHDPGRERDGSPDTPQEFREPEPHPDDAAREEKASCARLHRQRTLLTVPMLLTVLAAVLDGLDILPQVWYDTVWLRCGIPAAGLAACLGLAGGLWRDAWARLRRGQITASAAALLAALAALADSASCLISGSCQTMPFAAPAALLLYLCTCGQYRAARARYDSFRLVQLGGQPPYMMSVTAAGACKQQGHLEGFYRLWQTEDPAARWQPILTPLYLATATVLACVVALSGHQMHRFLWLWSALLSATIPLSLPLSGTLPMSLLCRRLYKSGSAVAGWQGARTLTAAQRVVVTDEDLFPAGVVSLRKKQEVSQSPVGTVALNGVKAYGEDLDHILAYAEALCRAAGSQLTPLLQQLMEDRVTYRYQVNDLHFYEDGGIDGTVRGATVSMGSAYFMKKRRVAIPHELKVDTGVFLAVDGRLAGVFAIKYLPSRNVEWALRALRRNRVTPVLATRGVNITPGLLKRIFRLNVRPIYPGVATRLSLAELTAQPGETPNAVIYRDGLLPAAEALIGSRRMCRAVRWSTGLSWAGGLCGLLLSYYLTSAGDFAALSPVYMLAYLLLWLLPTLLLSGLVKNY